MKYKRKLWAVIVLINLFFFCLCQVVFADCKDCFEVAKGKIPNKYIDSAVKELPSGIKIWDIDEAMAALKNKSGKILWVDTRPNSFFKMGTIKESVLLVCDIKGATIDEGSQGPEITKDRLDAAVKTVDADPAAVTVVFFCQGPKCHRSYNAALRTVGEYGYKSDHIVWFRAGYPELETHILDTPKLKKRITKYLQGDTI